MATKKTLYHGELRQMGPVEVTVVSDILESTFKKGTYYVTINVAGEERHYHPENQNCLDFWNGAKGKTFTLVALGGGKGKEDTATITYVGDGSAGQAAPPQRQAAAPAPAKAATPAPQRRGPAPHNTAVPAGHPQHQPPAPSAAAPPQRGTPPPHQQAGQRVGMAINQAVQYGIALQEEWNPQAIMERASDLIRISEALEAGKLCPKFSERNQPPA